jgi:prevent-host-death family protein
MFETLPLSEVKARLSELIARVEGQQDRVVITRNGRPCAVLISPDDLEGLEETLEIMSDPDLMKRIREGREAAERGDVYTLEEVRAEVSRRKEAGWPSGA